MDQIEHLRRQFAYDTWANREVLSAIRTSGKNSKRSLQLVAHILSASRLWMERIKKQPQSLPVWPEFTHEQCEAQVIEIGKLWQEYLASISLSGLLEKVFYKNSKGEPWNSSVGDIADHVILHGTYHRGQIATHMRENGLTPAYTDFIHAVRKGLIE